MIKTIFAVLFAGFLTILSAGNISDLNFNSSMPDEFKFDYENSCEKVLPLSSGIHGNEWAGGIATGPFSILESQALNIARALSADGNPVPFMKQALVPSQKTEAYLSYDGKYLYISCRAYEEKTGSLILSPSSKRDSNISGNDCIDIIIAPNGRKDLYYQIITDWKGNVCDIKYLIENGIKKNDISWNADISSTPSVEDKMWTAAIRILLDDLGLKKNDFADINICRNQIGKKEYSSWMPCKKSFHELESTARIWLGAKNEAPIKISNVNYPAPGIGKNPFHASISCGSQNAAALLTFSAYLDKKKIAESEKKLTLQAGKKADCLFEYELKNGGDCEAEIALYSFDGRLLEKKNYKMTLNDVLSAKLDSNEYFSDKKTAKLDVDLKIYNENLKNYIVVIGLLAKDGKNLFTVEPLKGNRFTAGIDISSLGDTGDDILLKLSVKDKSGNIIGDTDLKFRKTKSPFDF